MLIKYVFDRGACSRMIDWPTYFFGPVAGGAIYKGIPVENFVFQNGAPLIFFLLRWASNSVFLGTGMF